MKIALVTGANKGIGYEVAKQLAQLGNFVYLGCRDMSLVKKAIENLHTIGLINTEAIYIDVTKIETIKEAKNIIEAKSRCLDILVNNAGIAGKFPQPASSFPVEEIKKVFETNFFGVIQVTQEFLPLLKKSIDGRIVNVSSGLGSLSGHSDPNWKYVQNKPTGYSVSKAALNGYTIMLAFELKDTAIKVNSVDPEYTATDLNNFRGDRTPEHSAKVIVKYATLDKEGVTGKYFNEYGELSW